MVKRGKNLVHEGGELLDKLTSDCDDVLLQNSSVYTDPYHGNNFLKHLYEMYLTRTLTDVILCVENMEIHAHKMVLATNSPYFEGKVFIDLSSLSILKVVSLFNMSNPYFGLAEQVDGLSLSILSLRKRIMILIKF